MGVTEFPCDTLPANHRSAFRPLPPICTSPHLPERVALTLAPLGSVKLAKVVLCWGVWLEGYVVAGSGAGISL